MFDFIKLMKKHMRLESQYKIISGEKKPEGGEHLLQQGGEGSCGGRRGRIYMVHILVSLRTKHTSSKSKKWVGTVEVQDNTTITSVILPCLNLDSGYPYNTCNLEICIMSILLTCLRQV